MRNYFLAIIVTLFVIACGEKQDGFVLKGNIKGFKYGTIVAKPDSPKYKTTPDTIQVIDGKFEYRGRVESPTFFWFFPVSDDSDFLNSSFNLFMGNEDITIEGDIRYLKTKGDQLTVKGSPSHTEFIRLQKLSSSVKYGDAKGYIDLILNEPDVKTNDVISYYVFNNTAKGDIAERERYLSQLDKSLDNNIYVENMKSILENEKKIMEGSLAPDFTLKDIDGKEYKLSDFRGNYVLFEFSASWCSWCKKEIPYLQQAYEYGRDKNFIIFTINLDKTKELWEEEVKKGEVEWMQLSDLQGMSGGVASQYNITGIPQIFFIDKEGRILDNNLRGDEMVNLVKKTLDQNQKEAVKMH